MTTVTFTLTDSTATEGVVDVSWTTEGSEPTPATILAARVLDFVRDMSAALSSDDLQKLDITDVEPKQ